MAIVKTVGVTVATVPKDTPTEDVVRMIMQRMSEHVEVLGAIGLSHFAVMDTKFDDGLMLLTIGYEAIYG